ncbi:MAG: flagellar motor protein PomA [Methylococcales bacterium]|nr:flagellar motor protein PomA [Methylococcales bacterium]MBT7443055.1 flagellar motor protein PomA [Methylococcales bacterium]
MDIATLAGLIGGFGIIIGAIMSGGSILLFVNVPSLLLVVGGTLFVTIVRVPLSSFIGSFGVGMKAVMTKAPDIDALIEEAVELADIARKNGLLALEGKEISNDFLQKGIGLCIDGHDPSFVNKLLKQDIANGEDRHAAGADMFDAIGNMAPAMGMIGTLVGLVQMLANMKDPASIGPAMAVALLTTLYGAIIQNAFAGPVASKLVYRAVEESSAQNMITEVITAIQEGMNPKVLEQLLQTYQQNSKRKVEEE